MTYTTKQSVSPARRRLIELLQQVNYGRIERLRVSNGEPVLSPLPRIVREVKFGGENGPRPEVSREDFALKCQVRELYEYLDKLHDGTIEVLEVKAGSPFRMRLEEKAA